MRFFRVLPAIAIVSYISVLTLHAQDSESSEAMVAKTGTLVTNIDASGDWAYYSMAENRLIASDEKTGENWDVAFMGTSIMVNGAVQVVISPYDDITEAPEEGYDLSENAEGTQVPSGSGAGWFWYDPSTHSVYPNPETIHVIRTRNGNYAKFEVVSYYKDQNMDIGAPRFYSFRFTYQDDGSRNLK